MVWLRYPQFAALTTLVHGSKILILPDKVASLSYEFFGALAWWGVDRAGPMVSDAAIQLEA